MIKYDNSITQLVSCPLGCGKVYRDGPSIPELLNHDVLDIKEYDQHSYVIPYGVFVLPRDYHKLTLELLIYDTVSWLEIMCRVYFRVCPFLDLGIIMNNYFEN